LETYLTGLYYKEGSTTSAKARKIKWSEMEDILTDKAEDEDIV